MVNWGRGGGKERSRRRDYRMRNLGGGGRAGDQGKRLVGWRQVVGERQMVWETTGFCGETGSCGELGFCGETREGSLREMRVLWRDEGFVLT
ncbi:hypothetical protein Pmani_025418 [Petrolisthes manimaculis]|uniref:Uncharacterized protein n=1 Tax=Petrolisthes manimaculis TaxID=1843537 RepID=A0AAE1P7Z7_9EUCA|nr:hypothetical protein Pmani_025418 [Petrolisthes manimaculis]